MSVARLFQKRRGCSAPTVEPAGHRLSGEDHQPRMRSSFRYSAGMRPRGTRCGLLKMSWILVALASLGGVAASCSATGSDSSTGEITSDEEAVGFSLPDGYYRFGETSSEVSPSRFRPPTRVTVTAPEEFTPAEPAEQLLDVNMLFLVTFTNLSEDEGWSPTILTGACSDQEYRSFVPCSSPGELLFTDGRWTEYPDELGPGESMTFRVEYSLASSDFVTLELDIDGQAGPTIRFMSEAVSVA